MTMPIFLSQQELINKQNCEVQNINKIIKRMKKININNDLEVIETLLKEINLATSILSKLKLLKFTTKKLFFYDLVLLNPDKPWNWEYISENPNITWEIIQANPDKPWNWRHISKNSNITWDIIHSNPDKS